MQRTRVRLKRTDSKAKQPWGIHRRAPNAQPWGMAMTLQRWRACGLRSPAGPFNAGLAEAADIPLRPLGHLVEDLRRVKDEEEIGLLREACAITDRAFESVLPEIRAGVTERAVAIALERAMVDFGAEGPAFDSIVASGPNGAVPHHRPGGRELQPGDLVTLDFGARYGGYHADMTRTVAVGEPAGWQRDLYDLVARSQAAGRNALRPGVKVSDVDHASREVIEKAGRGSEFLHGLGHGVGLEIHEAPALSTLKRTR